MEGNLNPRVIGACLIGFALVGGAYTVANFGQPRTVPQSAAVVQSDAPARVAIAVTDNDNNGIEDWRDEFVETEPIVINTSSDEPYEPPETLTGQAGVNLMEAFLRSQTYEGFGRNQNEIIDDTVTGLVEQTNQDLYDLGDVTQLQVWTDQDVLAYANTIALAITNNNIENSAGELYILGDILEKEAAERTSELQAIADAYARMRDNTLATPVPHIFSKEHLDLVNTYHAIHTDVSAMMVSDTDPARALLRLRRYEDNATAMGYALQNMYAALLPYASLVSTDDPALLFATFSPDFN